jgi:hypothetical protein
MQRLLVICVIAAVVSGGCAREPVKHQPPPRLSTVAVPASNVYVSPGSRFRIALPGDWQQARFAVRENSQDVASVHPKAVLRVEVDYVPYDFHSAAHNVFGITVFPAADWPRIAASGLPGGGIVLAESSDYTYVATLTTSHPFAPASDDAKLYDAMRLSWPRLRQAFQLVGARNVAVVSGSVTPAVGVYEARVPASITPAKKIAVDLRHDGSATMSTEYVGKGRPTVNRARWNQKDDVVLLQVLEQDGKAAGHPLIWTLVGDRLVPKYWDFERYGSNGFTLLRKR